MSSLREEQVLSVHHWSDSLFSFKTTRNAAFRFENGHFTMMGLQQEGKPLLRAYSIVSANHEDELEFFSIKVPDGKLTSRLADVKVGDSILVSQKATGTLVGDHVLPGKNLYLLATGTGLAPFISLIKEPDIYERFEKVVLVHGVRRVEDLAYRDYLEKVLPEHEIFSDMISEQLLYYPTVTREPFENNGRITDLLKTGKLFKDLGMPFPTLEDDRFMLCGSPSMLKDVMAILDSKGFKESRNGYQGEYVIERAFVES